MNRQDSTQDNQQKSQRQNKQGHSNSIHASLTKRIHQSSHYFSHSQPVSNSDGDPDQRTIDKPSKQQIIDVFEFEPVGFMSHGRW